MEDEQSLCEVMVIKGERGDISWEEKLIFVDNEMFE